MKPTTKLCIISLGTSCEVAYRIIVPGSGKETRILPFMYFHFEPLLQSCVRLESAEFVVTGIGVYHTLRMQIMEGSSHKTIFIFIF